MASIPLDFTGYVDLPNDKVAFVVTYLEMREPPSIELADERSDVVLQRWHRPQPQDYRELFKEVGEDWLWFGRLILDDDKLAELLAEPTREHFLPCIDGRRMGLLEIDYGDPENPELAYFGLIPSAIGLGLGRWLMAQAVKMAWSRPQTKRFWVHTCTGDSPQALGFYRSCGFVAYKRAIEVADDPRARGLLAKDKAPHLPFLD